MIILDCLVDPKCNHGCSNRRKAVEASWTELEEGMWSCKQQPEQCSHRPRKASSPQGLEQEGNGLSPRASRESRAMLTLSEPDS